MKQSYQTILNKCLIIFLVLMGTTAQAQVQTARYINTCARSNAFYEYLPQGYATETQSYPLILFVHGAGEVGPGTTATLPNVLRNGPPKQINQGIFPTSFTVNSQTFKFIVISPQFTDWPSPTDINNVLNYAVQNYRVDVNRIYLTGLSAGGGMIWEYAGNNSTYANRIAAMVPIAGASWPDITRSNIMAAANLGVWATHNDGDGTVPVVYTNNYIANMNAAPVPPNPLAKKTIFASTSHDAWTKTYDFNFRENGLNVYEWMLTYKRNFGPNLLPVANAGADKTITLPTNSTTLTGTGTDPDGSIIIYAWTQLSGPANSTVSSPAAASTVVSGLVQGLYKYVLAVTDNRGYTSRDTVNVTVNPATTVNQLPTVNAGPDQTITLPLNTANLAGTATDTDGAIASYSWTKVAGPTSGTIASPAAANTAINSLVQGVYQFVLAATDNSGGIGRDTIKITVNAAGNAAPTVNAGIDFAISLPTSTATLKGVASDADGSIASYVWSKVTGPTSFAITTPNAAATTVTGLVQGVYTFRLTVTDNLGVNSADDIVVTVNGISNLGKSVRVNVFGGTNPFANSAWNNWNVSPSVTSAAFKYEDGTQSSITASINQQAGMADNGATYQPGATVCPPAVIRYNSFNTSNRIVSIGGLNPALKYSLQFFASRANSGNSSVFKIGTLADTISTDNNANDYAKFSNIAPDARGFINVDLYRIGTYNYLGGFVVTEQTTAARLASNNNTSLTSASGLNARPAGIYPNPVQQTLYINLNPNTATVKTGITLTNQLGQVIRSKELVLAKGQSTISFDVADLQPGIYFVTISQGGSQTTHRFVKAAVQ